MAKPKSPAALKPSIDPAAIGHRAACRDIELTEAQRRLIGAYLTDLAVPPAPPVGGTKPKTLRLYERFTISADEAAFVEALIIHATYKGEIEPGRLIRMTGDQVREIVGDRYPHLAWDDTQLGRLKTKYIWRPGKPATRFELLREVVKGDRRPGQAIGTPSQYLATGIKVFLAAV